MIIEMNVQDSLTLSHPRNTFEISGTEPRNRAASWNGLRLDGNVAVVLARNNERIVTSYRVVNRPPEET